MVNGLFYSMHHVCCHCKAIFRFSELETQECGCRMCEDCLKDPEDKEDKCYCCKHLEEEKKVDELKRKHNERMETGTEGAEVVPIKKSDGKNNAHANPAGNVNDRSYHTQCMICGRVVNKSTVDENGERYEKLYDHKEVTAVNNPQIHLMCDGCYNANKNDFGMKSFKCLLCNKDEYVIKKEKETACACIIY